MALSSPEVLVPTSTGSFRTSSFSQIVSGVADSSTTKVGYRYDLIEESTGGTPVFAGPLLFTAMSFAGATENNVGEPLPWSFNCSLADESVEQGKVLYLEFVAIDESTGESSYPTQVEVFFTSSTSLPISAPVPTGISVDRSNTYLRPTCAEVSLEGFTGDFLGYNFYVTLEPGGGTQGYGLMNTDYVVAPSSVKYFDSNLGSTEQQSGDVVVKTSTSYRKEINQYSFDLNSEALARLTGAGVLPNQNYDQTTTFYFVITTVMYDSDVGAVVESPYSPEISARYITFSAVYNEIPLRSRDQITVTLMQRIYGKNKKAHQMPASVYKDILDPISEEYSDYYVIQDFMAKTESIKGLLQFDDENGDGVSDPVETSVGKTRLRIALKLNNADAVQNLVNSYFDKKASNFNITRLSPTYSKGKALFYAYAIPEEGLDIADGTLVSTGPGAGNSNSPVQFRVTGSKRIPYAERSTFYNTVEKRYEIEADIISTTFGSLADVPAGSITHSVSGADPRFKVENTSPTTGGTNNESNLSLANRTQLAIAGVDTGTEGGYLLKALSVPGVRSARVEKSGDPLMSRDMDPISKRHLGGKVDVYVQSEYISEKQDIIAFSYAGPTGEGSEEQFFVEDAVNLRIRTNNSNVTPATPIFEVIRVYNVTRGKNYDTSGAVVGLGDGDTIQLAQNTANLIVGMATLDIIEVDYRYRGSSTYVLDNQPVKSIVSVTGDVDGVLAPESYELVKLEDPLQNGESTIARDGVSINFFNGYPTESTRQVNAEAHVFLSTKPLKLAKKGVDIDTIVVSSDEDGIDAYSKDLDYTVGKGGQAGYTYLYLQPFSKIRSGSEVFVSYGHSQNLKVVYTVNAALQDVQNSIEGTQHAAADVVVKGAVQNAVDISLHIIRRRGYSETSVVNKVKTTLGNYISNQHVGQSLMVDDVISLVKNTEGVKTLVLPITRMMKQNESFIPQDYVGYANFKVYTRNASRGVTSYISNQPVLNFGTLDGGGPSNMFRAVYENGTALISASSPLDVSTAGGRSYIQPDGRIIVSTTDGTPPQNKEYKASYYTYVAPEDEFSSDIQVSGIETLIVNSKSITVDASAEEA